MPVPTDVEVAQFADVMAEGHRRPTPAIRTPQKKKSELLDVWQYGNVAILQDADGEWWNEALDNLSLEWVMGSLYDAFYTYYEDDYDYVTFMMTRDLGVFFAFYQPMANDTKGIGYDAFGPQIYDTTDDTKVQGLIFMNYYGLWAQSPLASRYVFGQEFGHRWGAFVNVQKEGLDEDALLGRDLSHWSYWFDTPNSPMEGNEWSEQADATWLAGGDAELETSTYSDLDLYLMGLIPAEEVGEQTVLVVDQAEQDRVARDPAYTPEFFGERSPISVAATPVSFTIDDIVAAEGERSPDSTESQKEFRMAVVVLVLEGDSASNRVLTQIDELRSSWEADWEEDVRGLADLDTTLGATTAPEWGTDPDAEDETVAEDEESAATEEAAACACSAPSAGRGWLAGLLAAAAAAARRRR